MHTCKKVIWSFSNELRTLDCFHSQMRSFFIDMKYFSLVAMIPTYSKAQKTKKLSNNMCLNHGSFGQYKSGSFILYYCYFMTSQNVSQTLAHVSCFQQPKKYRQKVKSIKNQLMKSSKWPTFFIYTFIVPTGF